MRKKEKERLESPINHTKLTKLYPKNILCQTKIPAFPPTKKKKKNQKKSRNCNAKHIRLDLTLDQHLNRTSLRALGGGLERLHCILEAEAMSDEVLHVDDTVLDEADGAWPGVGVAVLELQVDLLGAEAHEGELHVGLADADDKDFAAEFDRVDLQGSVSQ